VYYIPTPIPPIRRERRLLQVAETITYFNVSFDTCFWSRSADQAGVFCIFRFLD
jgi:hypothetical protein